MYFSLSVTGYRCTLNILLNKYTFTLQSFYTHTCTYMQVQTQWHSCGLTDLCRAGSLLLTKLIHSYKHCNQYFEVDHLGSTKVAASLKVPPQSASRTIPKWSLKSKHSRKGGRGTLLWRKFQLCKMRKFTNVDTCLVHSCC